MIYGLKIERYSLFLNKIVPKLKLSNEVLIRLPERSLKLDWDIDYSKYNPVHELYIVDELIATLEQDIEDKNCYSINSKLLNLEDYLINCSSLQEARKTVEWLYRDYMNS